MNELDERSILLLQEILATPGIRMKGLEEKLKLSRSQVNYSLQKVNEWLVDKDLPIIENNRRTGFYVDESIASVMDSTKKNASYCTIPSEVERQYLICILLLCRTEEISLFHLADALKISRNTVLHDLKRTTAYVEKNEVSIQYNRRNGYSMTGTEFNKRKLLIETVHLLLKAPQGHNWIREITQLPLQEIEAFKRRFEKVESRLKVTFTDEKMHELPYVLLLLLKRMSMGKSIQQFDIHFSDLSNTKEYRVVEDLLWNMGEIDENDRLFITLKLLSTNVTSTELNKKKYKELLQAIDNMLMMFEVHACITLQDKQQLKEKIYQHLKPAMYRIMYGLTTVNPLLEEIKREHKDVHHLVKKSIEPVVTFVKKEIPEDEIGYLTLLIKSWLHKYGDKLSKKLKAIVVCPNGISVSKLLFETLREIFPDIILLDHISIREFSRYTMDFDIVFSTVALTTNKKLFIVNSLLSEKQKLHLQMRVSQELYGYSPSKIDYDALFGIIEKYTDIKNEQVLKRELIKFFEVKVDKKSTHLPKDKPTLEELIEEDCIQLTDEVANWEEAIRLAAEPLLNSNKISSEYIDCMIQKYNPEEPYIIIAPSVAIPHASPEEGVNHLSMSLLRINREVEFAPNIPVHLVFVIAATDRKQHLKALMQLNELVSNEQFVKNMIKANKTNEIMHYIKKVSVMEVLT